MSKKYKPSEYMDLVKELILKNYPEEEFDSMLELNGETKSSNNGLKPAIFSWEDIYHVKRKGETKRIEFKWGIVKEMDFNTGQMSTVEDLVNSEPTMNIHAFFHREDYTKEKVAKMFMQTNNFKAVDLFYPETSFADTNVNELPLEEALEKMIQAAGLYFS